MIIQSLSDYISLVKAQQASNLDSPKIEPLFNSISPLYTESQAINSVLTEPYIYLSCKILGSTYYWEFLKNNNITDFTKFKFIYIRANLTNFNLLISKLPYYYSWSKYEGVYLTYPDKSLVIDTDSSSWGAYYSTTISDTFIHPFLPTFNFTGNICLLKDRLLYEYIDSKGWYGILNLSYLTPFRPINLTYPLGNPNGSQLIVDNCYNSNINKYSNRGDANFAGRYIGQYTTKDYNKHIKFWLYQNSSSTFLLEYPPSFDTEGLALSSIYSSTKTSITKLISNSTCTFNINQSSSTSIINL